MDNKNRKDIFKKDASFSTFRVGETNVNGEILHHPPEFPDIQRLLESLKDFTPRSDDVFLLSYSKAGTHWMYEIIRILLQNKLDSLKEEKSVGMFELCNHMNQLESLPSPRILNTHIRYKYLPNQLFQNNKIICIIRNPKSVAVSYYHHTHRRGVYEYSGNFEGYLPTYIEGYHNLYGNWFDYVTEYWTGLKDKKNVHFVFYEELKQNPIKVIEEVSQFLELKHSKEFCTEVGRLTSFEYMSKSKEKPKILDVINVFRKGTTTDWKNYFTVKQNEDFDVMYNMKMQTFPQLKEKIRFS